MKLKTIILFLFLSVIATAHEIRPAYLHLDEVEPDVFEVFWKVPSRGDAIPKLEVIFPIGTSIEQEGVPQLIDGFANFNYTVGVKDGLQGRKVRIRGLKNTLIDVLFRVEYLNGEQVTVMLQPDKNFLIVPGRSTTWQVMRIYTVLGIEHIIFGFDHLLFVLALIIIARDKWKIIKTVTAFTLAHSITLSLASLGFVALPGAPVEAVIALSIVYLAVEILQLEKGKPTLTSKMPWLVAFSFGLLHGFGFAGALAEIGLPQQAIPIALAFFNLGVELGQLAFVFVILTVAFYLNKIIIPPRWVPKFGAYVIGSIAAFWMIERVVGFWS